MAGRTSWAVDFQLNLISNMEAEIAATRTQMQGLGEGLEADMTAAAQNAKSAWDNFFDTLQARGQEITAIGSMLETNLSAPVRAGLESAFSNFGDLSNSLKASIGATLGELAIDPSVAGPVEQMLLNQIVQEAATSARTTLDIADSQTILARSGQSPEDIVNLIPTIVELSIALGEPMQGLADKIAVLEIAFNRVDQGLSAEGMADSPGIPPEVAARRAQELLADHSDLIITLLQSTPMNFGDFSQALPYILAPSAIYNIPENEMFAGLGAMAFSGIVGEKGGTTLRRMIDISASPNKAERERFEDFNIDATIGGDFVNAEGSFRGVIHMLNVLERSIAEDGMLQPDLMSIYKVRAGTGAAAMVNFGSDELQDLIGLMDEGSDGDRASVQRQVMEDSAAFPLIEFMSKIEALGVKIMSDGGGAETINDAIESMSDLVDYINGLDQETLRVLTRALLAISVAGPGLLGVGALFMLISAMSSRFTLIVTAATAAGLALFVFYEKIEDFWQRLNGIGQSERAQRLQLERLYARDYEMGDPTNPATDSGWIFPNSTLSRDKALSEQVYAKLQTEAPNVSINDLLEAVARGLGDMKFDLTIPETRQMTAFLSAAELRDEDGMVEVLNRMGITPNNRFSFVEDDFKSYEARFRDALAIDAGDKTFADVVSEIPMDANAYATRMPRPVIEEFRNILGPLNDGKLQDFSGLMGLINQANESISFAGQTEAEIKLAQLTEALPEQILSVPDEIEVIVNNLETAVEAMDESSANSQRLLDLYEAEETGRPAPSLDLGARAGQSTPDPDLQPLTPEVTAQVTDVSQRLEDFDLVLASTSESMAHLFAAFPNGVRAQDLVLPEGKRPTSQGFIDSMTGYYGDGPQLEAALERAISGQILGIRTDAPIDAVVNMPALEAQITSQGLATTRNGITTIEGTVTLPDGQTVTLAGGTATLELGPRSLQAIARAASAGARQSFPTGQSTGALPE